MTVLATEAANSFLARAASRLSSGMTAVASSSHKFWVSHTAPSVSAVPVASPCRHRAFRELHL